ncbi:MAG: TonB-dependent receptor [Gammaproteobacteria bacterium]|nr:TonB-dependent receptor [Gammaproteobacteria bacterium]
MKKLLIFTCSILSLLIISNIAIAAEESTHSFMTVPPVVVSATRFETSIDTAPVNVTTITADDIAHSGASTLADVLKYQAGVNVSSLFGISSSGSKIDLGGFGENGAHNTLVLINGRRLNDMDIQGPNLAAIPLGNIAQIEIIHGSATVLYGDNAVSGVINIVTKNAFDGERTSVKLQAGSFQTRSLTINHHQIFGQTALSVSIDSLQSNGYRDNNVSKSMNFMGEASRENADWRYGTRINVRDEKSELPGSLNEPEYKSSPKTSNSEEEAEEQRYTIEAFVEGDLFAAEFALRDKHQDYVAPDAFGGIFTSEADLRTLSFTPRAKRQYGTHTVVAGIDLYSSNLDTLAVYESLFFNSRDTRDIKQDSYGLYMTDTIKINERIILSLGLRNHTLTVKANDIGDGLENKRNDNINSWDITLNRKHRYGARNYLRLAKSFRSPVLDEMWNFTSAEFTLIKPQTGLHYEIGTRQTFSNGFKMDANLFRIDLKDEIAFDLATFNNINLDKTRREGLNINLQAPISKKINIHAGYAYRKASFRSGTNNGKTVPLVPNNKLTASANYRFSKTQKMGLGAIYTGKRYFGNDDSNAGKQMPAYTRLDANYTQRFEKLKARVQITNLTDVKAADTSFYRASSPSPYYYYPLPERAINISLEGNF